MFSTDDDMMYRVATIILATMFIIFMAILIGNRKSDEHIHVNAYEYKITTIDNCEYIKIDINWIHKGNCNNPVHKEIK